MKKPSLPDTLSDTLALAIADARSLDRTLYLPHYRFWHGHDTTHSEKCLVCLAGSIISRTLKVDHLTITTPGSYPLVTDRKLRAVNACRSGDFNSAFSVFHDCIPPSDLQVRFISLPKPVHFIFIGWEEFIAHLDSLESIIPALREIENEALRFVR